MVVERDMDCAREQGKCHKADYFLDPPGEFPKCKRSRNNPVRGITSE